MWKEVFKAGFHTDANGNEREWTEEDLDAIVEKYNNQLPDDRHEAPVVIGHPVNNSPAYAWVEELKRDGDTLLARFSQLDPDFEELVKDGRYKKVSIALYPDMMLRHVGFLGAVPPAVKGLKDSDFVNGQNFICFENGDDLGTRLGKKNLYLNDTQSDNLSGILSDTQKNVDLKGVSSNESIINLKKDDKTGKGSNASKIGNERSQGRNQKQYQELYQKRYQNLTRFEEKKEKTEKEKIPPYNPPIKEKDKKERKDQNSFSKSGDFEGELVNSDTNQKLINFQGGDMQENYSKLFQELLGWLGTTFNEEIANQTAAELEKMKEKYLDTKKDANSSKQGIEASDSAMGVEITQSKEFQELQKKLEQLESDNREMKFNEYFKSQLGRLVPAQKQIVRLAFEAVKNNVEGFQFSENGKQVKVSGEELIKKLIESFPMQVEFSEIARKDAFSDSSGLEDQNKFIDEYNKGK